MPDRIATARQSGGARKDFVSAVRSATREWMAGNRSDGQCMAKVSEALRTLDKRLEKPGKGVGNSGDIGERRNG